MHQPQPNGSVHVQPASAAKAIDLPLRFTSVRFWGAFKKGWKAYEYGKDWKDNPYFKRRGWALIWRHWWAKGWEAANAAGVPRWIQLKLPE